MTNTILIIAVVLAVPLFLAVCAALLRVMPANFDESTHGEDVIPVKD